MSCLVLPLVSVGNIPQLCIDWLLNSQANEWEYLEALDSKYLVEFVGPLDRPEDGSDSLYKDAGMKYSSALEVFYNKKRGLFAIQQRTPLVSVNYLNNFIVEIILPFLSKYNISEICIWDSLYAMEDENGVIVRPQEVYSLGEFYFDDEAELLSNLHLNDQESMVNNWLHFTPTSFQDKISVDQPIFKILFQILNASQRPKALRSIKYCSCLANEGDNSLDSQQFLQWIISQKVIKNAPPIVKFVRPISWQGAYGMADARDKFVDLYN
ncbi:BAH_G0030840.mRNA.1.CDS.1 [Saccharomyces cerevisiae]|nr:SX2_G0002870.mRNA.1.CDS.1 [Saccharomyces cerevisiae]CAI4551672.1 BAG_1a_G0030920.mRNA.1.CDS.1 [Saccharomyces cerevisiae]CAI4551871.1 BAH_G0030840.mRNA.1.CDS.1 [Saccharomyces cerevisiae]CAI7171372.1 BAG_1a_G0030920.mRNA.1.CDS.1 [Saccharomyces cerevisiae]CAI7172546.1 BAH_G0030840.mRNA.1.CDS.1 [Saccharomyces cerevisiae]